MGWFTKKISSFFRRKVFRIEADSDIEKQNIEEEMLETLERASTAGSIDLEEDEREMIHSIFELGDTMAREIMVPRIDIKFVKEDLSYQEIQQLVDDSGHSRFPLIGNDLDDIIGVIFVKDLFLNTEKLVSGEMSLKDLARKPLIVPEGKKVDELLRDMKKMKSHFAVVIDEYGGTAGMVTIEDIVEEIVGEIEDEYDSEIPPIREIEPGQYIVNANLSIEELNDGIDTGLPDTTFETVGGFIYDQVGSLPEEGQVISKGNVKFIVDKISGQRIMSVRVMFNNKESSGNGNDAGN